MNITVAYQPTVAEVDNAIRANSRGARTRILVGAILVLACGAFQIIASTLGAGTFFLVTGVVSLLVGLLFVLVLTTFKTVRESTAARLCVPTTVGMNAERYTFQLPSVAGETRWELTTVVTSAECWTLAVANRISLVIPKRALAPEDAAQLSAFLAGSGPKLVKVA